MQQNLSKSNMKNIGLSFDCWVLHQRIQYMINVESSGGCLSNNLSVVLCELMKVRDDGLPQGELDAPTAQKSLEL